MMLNITRILLLLAVMFITDACVMRTNPHFRELVGEMGAKPTSRVIFMDTNEVTKIHLYVSCRLPEAHSHRGDVNWFLTTFDFVWWGVIFGKV